MKNEIEYHLQMLDNGIVLAAPEFDYTECKEFEGKGNDGDTAMHNFIGREIWSDILNFCNESLSNSIKFTLTFEEDN